MSGIAGIWNRDGRPAEEEILSRCRRAVSHRGLAGTATGASGASISFDGRLDNRDELGAVGKDRSDAALALDAYEIYGASFLKRLKGDFALAVSDPRARLLLLARDVVGVRPLYYFASRDFVVFSSEIKGVLAHPRVPTEIDREGIADYSTAVRKPLEQLGMTCFAGVSSVPAAHVVVFSPERTSSARYWDFGAQSPLRLKNFAEYAEAFRELFARSVARRARGVRSVAVAVSGGLDSSSVFCQAKALGGFSVEGLSFTCAGTRDADEDRFLAELERDPGTAIHRIPVDHRTGFARGVREQVRQIETPLVDYFWEPVRGLYDAARDRGAGVMLSGHFSDQLLFCADYLVDRARAGDVLTPARHLREYRRWFGAEETRWRRRRFFRQLARELVGRSRSDAPLEGAYRRELYLEVRSRCRVHTMEWWNKAAALHGMEHAFPFLDADLLEFLFRIPGEMQNCGGIPRAILRKSMEGLLPHSISSRTWKADFGEPAQEVLERDRTVMVDALRSHPLCVSQGLVDSHAFGHENIRDVADRFGIETWCREFLKIRGNDEEKKMREESTPGKESLQEAGT